jgi:hypothetical protein
MPIVCLEYNTKWLKWYMRGQGSTHYKKNCEIKKPLSVYGIKMIPSCATASYVAYTVVALSWSICNALGMASWNDIVRVTKQAGLVRLNVEVNKRRYHNGFIGPTLLHMKRKIYSCYYSNTDDRTYYLRMPLFRTKSKWSFPSNQSNTKAPLTQIKSTDTTNERIDVFNMMTDIELEIDGSRNYCRRIVC